MKLTKANKEWLKKHNITIKRMEMFDLALDLYDNETFDFVSGEFDIETATFSFVRSPNGSIFDSLGFHIGTNMKGFYYKNIIIDSISNGDIFNEEFLKKQIEGIDKIENILSLKNNKLFQVLKRR